MLNSTNWEKVAFKYNEDGSINYDAIMNTDLPEEFVESLQSALQIKASPIYSS